MGQYLPLYKWLVGQLKTVRHIPSTFKQIEGILGFDLPPTARKKSQWWENNSNRHSHAKAWLDAGYHTQEVDTIKETVAFSR